MEAGLVSGVTERPEQSPTWTKSFKVALTVSAAADRVDKKLN